MSHTKDITIVSVIASSISFYFGMDFGHRSSIYRVSIGVELCKVNSCFLCDQVAILQQPYGGKKQCQALQERKDIQFLNQTDFTHL